MTTTTDELLSAFFDEMEQTGTRYAAFARKAEQAGFPRLAKLFRAVVASEKARTRLYRSGMVTHADDPGDIYVCPHCGLLFIPEAPETCPVDETPAEQFERIG